MAFNELLNESKIDNIVYHGGNLHNTPIHIPFFVSYDKNQAKEYADGNNDILYTFTINTENIIHEYQAMKILKDNNFKSKIPDWDLNELNIYEILDENFDTSLSNKDIAKYFNILRNNRITGIEFLDMNIISLKNDIRNVLVIDTAILSEPHKL